MMSFLDIATCLQTEVSCILRYTCFMILLLSGGTDIARAMLIERLLKERPQWRHIALEEFEVLPMFAGMPTEEQLAMSVSLALACSEEMLDEDFSIVLSRADAMPILDVIQEEMEDQKITTVHIGPKETGEGFDHCIDTVNRSAGDVYMQLEKIIAKAK